MLIEFVWPRILVCCCKYSNKDWGSLKYSKCYCVAQKLLASK